MSTNTHETKSFNPKLLWLVLVAIIVIAGGVWFGLNSTSESAVTNNTAAANDLPAAPIAGHHAPDFTLRNLEGQEVSLSDFRGQPVIINFWATWCGPCRVEMPEFQNAFNAHETDGLVVLGVNLTERDSIDAVPGFLDEFGLTFPVVLDQAGDVANTYNVFGQPASVFVNKDGTVHQVFYGPVNKTFIDDRIAELFSS